jgi:hypothetical protein
LLSFLFTSIRITVKIVYRANPSIPHTGLTADRFTGFTAEIITEIVTDFITGKSCCFTAKS